MGNIRLTGREIGIPGNANHSQQCTVDGQTVTVAIADIDAGRRQEIARALSASLTSNRSGVRRAILETLRTTLRTQGSSEVH